MPAKQQSPYDHARRLIDADVAQHAGTWAATIGLTPTDATDARFGQFREDVTWALDTCLRTHIFGNQYRPSDVRDYLLDLSDAYLAVAEKLRKAQALRDRLPLPLYHEFQLAPDPLPMEQLTEQLTARAEAARLDAEDQKHRHRELLPAFNALAKGLVIAYRRTGYRGSERGARKGRLLDFVDSVLSAAKKIAKIVTRRSLKTPKDLDKQLHRIERDVR